MKTIRAFSRPLSREQMKAVTAGLKMPPPNCGNCLCEEGPATLINEQCQCQNGQPTLPCLG